LFHFTRLWRRAVLPACRAAGAVRCRLQWVPWVPAAVGAVGGRLQ